MHTFDLSMEHITKIEGDASISVKVENDKVTDVKFQTVEYKRFFTEAMKGKPVMALPAHLARICGTCSNAHIMAAIEACEDALGITPSEQTEVLRSLTMHGLTIRDHALHLYLFSLPDIYGKDAFLDLDENIPEEHQILDDGFGIKAAGNFLATLVAGRSVHAQYPTIGGFLHFPDAAGIADAIAKLDAIRPAALRLIEIFAKQPFHFDRKTNYMALVPDGNFGYIKGAIKTSRGETFPEKEYRNLLEHVVLPYSQASAYAYKGESYLVGALARINIAKEKLHPKTKASIPDVLTLFPSTDVYHNNLAQAIEILHSIDEAAEILRSRTFAPEPLVKQPMREGVGIGVVEAPRGTLYHKVVLNADGTVKEGEVIVPTGQNQINIEQDVGKLIEQKLAEGMEREKLGMEMEKLIRAYDPCMSCAAHFLKVKWM
ncbi:MAG TPA: nickel-dependent hydrogenase large subunit [Candidatus Paceibacterota bacterium]|nr:nickel-dependent hydrogenase large subunit [Candidatus Paceibacterota bacterium]